MSEDVRPTRREVLLTTAAVAGAAPFSASSAAIAAPRGIKQPNIVWVVCHDIHAPLLGTYGNPLARTPVIDRLAAQGIRFDNAFSVAPVCAPSRFALITGMYPESCGPADHMRAVGHVPSDFASLPELMRQAGYWTSNNVFTDYNCDLDPERIWDAWSDTAHWRQRPAGKPFFCVYNYMITHESRVINFKGDPVTGAAAVTVPPYLPDRPEIRTAIARNVDLVNRQDAALATLLGQLEEDGLADDTIVFFLADHGGVAPRSKRYCYDEGLRVPLIVRVPDALAHLRAGHAPGRPSRQVVSNVDLAPTTLALAGAPIPENMEGIPFLGDRAKQRRVAFSMRNRMDERYDMVRTARDERYRYIRNYSPHRIYGLHNAYQWQLAGYQVWEQAHLDGDLDGAQDRFWRPKPAEELYDLRDDPHQLVNLADDPAHGGRLRSLQRALDEHMIAVNDNGFIPEGLDVEGYRQSREPGAYPLRPVLALAAKAIGRRPSDVPEFVRTLGATDACLRFWAAQGLLMAGALPAETLRLIRDRLDSEADPHVRCVLAEALGGREGARALAAVLRSDVAPRVKLQGLEALTYLPAADVRPEREAIVTAGKLDEYTSGAANYLLARIDGTYTPATRMLTFAMPMNPTVLRQLGDPRI